MVKDELCEMVVEVRRVSDGVMNLAVFEEYVHMLICGYVSQNGRSLEEKYAFCR